MGVLINQLIDKRLRCPSQVDVGIEIPQAGELDIGGPIGLRVEPVSDLPCSAAFYDEESETLSVHIIPFAPYYSFLELGNDRIDTDESGRPVFIEVVRAQKDWQIVPELSLPAVAEGGSLCFRQTRRRFAPPEILTDPERKTVCLKFLARRGNRVVRLGQDLLAEVADGFLVAIWIGGIRPDFGEHQQARWRAGTAARLRREGRRWRSFSGRGLSQSCASRPRRQFFA